MATINRQQLLNDVKLWLPSNNSLSDEMIGVINESIITIVGDDDENYSEVLCKSLNACAIKNRADASANIAGGLKKIRTGPFEEEYYEGSAVDGWTNYINSLDDICPLLPGGGYSLSKGIGINISPGDTIDVNNTTSGCSTTSSSDLYL